MPKLYTAEGVNGTTQPVQVSPNAFGAQIGESLQELGQTAGAIGRHFAAIDQKVQDQKDDLQAYDIAGQLDQHAELVRQQLSAQTSLTDQEIAQQYKAMVTNKMDELLQGTSEQVGFAIKRHMAQNLGRQTIELRHATVRNRIADNEALLNRVTEQRLNDYPKITDPIEQATFFARQKELLDRSWKNGLLSEEDAQKRYDKFVTDAVMGQMNRLRVTDRTALFSMEQAGHFDRVPVEDRVKVLAQANEDRRNEQRGQEELFKRFKGSVEVGWQVMANRQSIPGNMLQDALDGKDPFIGPDEARRYAEQNSRPVIKSQEDDLPTRTVMQWYHSGESSPERIASARKKLAAIAKGNVARESIDKAFNELQTDERTMRTIQAQEISAGIHFAQDEYKKRAPPLLPGKLGQMQKNQQDAELAELRNEIRKNQGKDPGKTVDKFLKRKEDAIKAIPQRNKDVMDLVK